MWAFWEEDEGIVDALTEAEAEASVGTCGGFCTFTFGRTLPVVDAESGTKPSPPSIAPAPAAAAAA